MSNGVGIQIKKRDGSVEPLDINKIHFVVEEATDGTVPPAHGTSVVQVCMAGIVVEPWQECGGETTHVARLEGDRRCRLAV